MQKQQSNLALIERLALALTQRRVTPDAHCPHRRFVGPRRVGVDRVNSSTVADACDEEIHDLKGAIHALGQ